MGRPLRVLLVEDSEDDAELLVHELRNGGFDPVCRRIETAGTMRSALDAEQWDVVISDYRLPRFSAPAALELLAGSGLDLPFIVISGVVPMEKAVALMKAGAHDFVGKEDLSRLVPAIERELRDAEVRRQRNQVEDALRESERQFRAILDNSPAIIYLKDRSGGYLTVNRRFEEFIGGAASEIQGKTVFELFPREVAESIQASDNEVFETGLPLTMEETLRHGDNERTFMSVKFPLFDSEGVCRAVGGIGTDVTEQKQAEIQLRQVQKMEAIGTLAGGIAHDFNNILTAIIGYTHLIADELSEDSGPWADAEQILHAANRAKNLISQILTFSHQRGGRREPVDVPALVKEVLLLIRASIPANIEITRDNRSLHGTVFADPTQIHQLIMNLCANSADAIGEEPGVIHISLENIEVSGRSLLVPGLPRGQYVVLSVRDTGCGMDEATRERIFDPFFTTKEVGVGTGMGLAVVHGIVRELGGEIRVTSEPGKGTDFQLFLPVLERKTESAASGSEDIPIGEGRILLVDDEEQVIEVQAKVLGRLGYEVVACTSSVVALSRLRKEAHRFDLVITDQAMPSITGEALAREIHRMVPSLPIIMCSGLRRSSNGAEEAETGIQAYIQKPFDPAEMALTVHRVLERAGPKATRKRGTSG